MGFGTWLQLTVALAAVDVIVGTLGYVSGQGEASARAFLVARALVDTAFVGTNLRRLQLSGVQVWLLVWVLGHGLAGMFVWPELDANYRVGRAASDVLWPTAFLLKVVVLTSLVAGRHSIEREITALAKAMFLLSGVQVGAFLLAMLVRTAYPGITPPINLPLAHALAGGGLPAVLLSLGLVVLSGKRAFLVAAVCAVGWTLWRRFGGIRSLIALPVLGVVVLVLGEVIRGDMWDKWQLTVTGLRAATVGGWENLGENPEAQRALYLATAGRSAEVVGLLPFLAPTAVLLGAGAGLEFTVELLTGETYRSGFAHFSPLALTAKFGVVWMLVCYWHMFRGAVPLLLSRRPTDYRIGLLLMLFFVQSFFAFGLFMELLLPLAVALARVGRDKESDACAA